MENSKKEKMALKKKGLHMSHRVPLHLDVNVIARSASDATGQSNDSDRKYLESSPCQNIQNLTFFSVM